MECGSVVSTALATLPANAILHSIFPSCLSVYLAAVESPSLLTAVSWLPWFRFVHPRSAPRSAIQPDPRPDYIRIAYRSRADRARTCADMISASACKC